MTMWQDVASPRSSAPGRARSRPPQPRRDLPAHPLEARRLEARRSAARRFIRRAAPMAGLGAAAVCVLVGGLHLVKRMPQFRVEQIEVEGVRYLTRDQVRSAAGVTGPVSVWENHGDMTARLEDHPLVESVRITRTLPSTIVIRVEEAVPVGLVALPVVVAVNRSGDVLPLDPTEPILDLPVLRLATSLATASWGMRILASDVGRVAEEAPEVFAVLSEAKLYDREAVLLLGDPGLRVRYRPPISRRRLRDAVIAINDASGRLAAGSVREIDLRFADQVIVRTAAVSATEEGVGG